MSQVVPVHRLDGRRVRIDLDQAADFRLDEVARIGLGAVEAALRRRLGGGVRIVHLYHHGDPALWFAELHRDGLIVGPGPARWEELTAEEVALWRAGDAAEDPAGPDAEAEAEGYWLGPGTRAEFNQLWGRPKTHPNCLEGLEAEGLIVFKPVRVPGYRREKYLIHVHDPAEHARKRRQLDQLRRGETPNDS